MIGYLRGRIRDVDADTLLLDVQGVGYEIFCPQRLLDESRLHLGELSEVWISTHVREDAFLLFGFGTRDEKRFFLDLLKVNGVGPKLALNALSGGTPTEIAQLIENEDVKALTRLPKVGKKTAEQMILTLKGKLVSSASGNETPKTTGVAAREVSSALVNLGFRPVDVDRVVGKLAKDISFEDGVRQGLQALTTL